MQLATSASSFFCNLLHVYFRIRVEARGWSISAQWRVLFLISRMAREGDARHDKAPTKYERKSMFGFGQKTCVHDATKTPL